METIFLLFQDEAKTIVTGFSMGEQPIESQPYQLEVELTDQRYQDYLNMTIPKPIDVVTAKRDELLALAAIRVAPLQDAVDLDDATDEETAMLKQWKLYRVALNRIEQQSGYPLSVEWPVKPS